MGPDIGPKKTMIVAVIVVGCFAVLWPKVFHPMFFGTVDEYIKPSAIDRSTGCCDVFSEKDISTIKIMTELCVNINRSATSRPLSSREILSQCKSDILKTCGIDVSAVLQEKIRLGSTVKQILNEVRSLNGSLCLKYNFGIAPWRLGVPHRVVSNFKATTVRQERPPHLRAEMMHPAFRERGSAIPSTQGPQTKPSKPKVLEGRPGPIPGMRPPMGGAGHVVPPSQKGSSMGIIMPIYTIGIVIFFTYTLMKLVFRKQPESVGGTLYPPVEQDTSFRKDVFESSQLTSRMSKDVSSKIVVNAMSALLDEVDEEIEARRKANEFANQVNKRDHSHGNNLKEDNQEADQPSVKILGIETTASCEGGQKWIKSNTIPVPIVQPTLEMKEPPQEIFLEGALPAQSQLLVTDAKVETNSSSDREDAVVLAGKMTLSVISLDAAPDETNREDGTDIGEVEDGGATEDVISESKYTTASCTTAAEQDVSEEEETDEDELIEDIEVNHQI